MIDDESPVGWGRPPKSTRWPKGVTGNRKGRPRKVKSELPHDRILGQIVTVRSDGQDRKMTAEGALLHLVVHKALTVSKLRPIAKRILATSAQTAPKSASQLWVTYVVYPERGEVDWPLRQLRLAELLRPYEPSAKLVLEPWIVEAALERLERVLSRDEQEVVHAATRKPHKVAWPPWWSTDLRS
jgi:hypothetical protein